MHFTGSTFVAILSTASTSLAMPAEDSAPKLVARSITFHAYDYDNFGTPVLDQVIDLDHCLNLRPLGWSNRIASIKVPAGYRCRFWDSETCNGDNTPSLRGDVPALYEESGGNHAKFNDRATSIKCYKN